MCFKRGESIQLEAFSDADYTSDESHRSTSDILISMNGFPIYWRSQLQKIVTLSTTEAEFVSGSDATKQLILICNLLIELNLIEVEPTPVYIDNNSAIKITNDERTRFRTKHIDEGSQWLFQASKKKIIEMKKIEAGLQKADILTKQMSKQRFQFCQTLLGLILLCNIITRQSTGVSLDFLEKTPYSRGKEVFYTKTSLPVFIGQYRRGQKTSWIHAIFILMIVRQTKKRMRN